MKLTLFSTPVITPIFRLIGNSIMRAAGWRVDGKLPDIPKFVLIGAPHTSNWDFVLFLGVFLHLRAEARYMGKAELFRPPYGWFFDWCGGVPVDRSKSSGLVDQMVEECNRSKKFILVIAPEGTRYHTPEWKRGFYHIAVKAGIPIVLAVVDGKHKEVRIGQVFQPTDDIEGDMQTIQGFFDGVVGINPRRKYITLKR
jgi:1-acyl-sn-glycerol-3-phosphate acyltransferase